MQKKRKCVFKTPLLGEFPGAVSTSSGASGEHSLFKASLLGDFPGVSAVHIYSIRGLLAYTLFLFGSLIVFLPWAETGDSCFPPGTPRTPQ